jgi:hypothetical protein
LSASLSRSFADLDNLYHINPDQAISNFANDGAIHRSEPSSQPGSTCATRAIA